MSTFTLPEPYPPYKVTLPHDVTEDHLLNFPAFKNWITTLQHSLDLQKHKDHVFHASPYKLRGINVQSAVWFGKRLGFVKIQATIEDDEKNWLPGAVFLRGGSVGMLMILQPDDVPKGTEIDKYVILTVQPRIAAASFAFTEIPAGMLDGETFTGAAAKEIEEETALVVPQDELEDMTSLALTGTSTSPFTTEKDRGEDFKEKLQNAMYPSPGACDEFIPLFLWQKRVPRSFLDGLRGRCTGLRNEGERITLKVVKLEDLWREGARDAKALAALALYEGLRKVPGKLKPIHN
ncbi:nudix hydrolase 14 [Lindgomyces ingoldianus]|uniref:Nudix hydrolase 14 n=1 Tax=Lindgomyces ingoldianus TaxID=673940 RepID=A0ACB6RDY0_9PLEO|nr:nudix hydrolase 14 [Lindgomyces ingoldianus]KAF2477449.1 nudix hydrolase 14 [Lindgomyces ingoldianus]